MEPNNPNEKIEYWREHVERALIFEGTQAMYAEQNGISASKLSFWKGKLASKPSFAKVNSDVKVVAPAPQAKNEPKLLASPIYPDAVWLAKFVKELLR